MKTITFLSFFLCISSFSVFSVEEKKEQKQSDHKKDDKHEHTEGDVHDHDEHEKDDKHKSHKDKDDKHNHGSHDDHGDEGGGKAIGKGKAIEEVDEVKGFRLSKEAIKTLKLKLTTVDGSSFKVEKNTLITSKDKKGVYRFRANFFKFLTARIIKEQSDGYMIEVEGVEFGDQIVVDGVGLLRVADVYSTDESEYGHAH